MQHSFTPPKRSVPWGFLHTALTPAGTGWRRDGKLAALRNGPAKGISDCSGSHVSSSEWTVGVGRIQRRSWQHVGSVSAILSNVGVACSPHGVCRYKTAGDQTEQFPQRDIFGSQLVTFDVSAVLWIICG